MRQVFVGSSTEALRYAEQIRDVLAAQADVEPLMWNRLFELGTLTFEAIERAARKIVGAVLVATPDDDSVIRGTAVKVPRTNVMIEFGYLTAILGRTNIALCKYDGVELATDLKGFTYVPMGEYSGHAGSRSISVEAAQQLARWAGSLPRLAESVPLGNVVHGYTGRWKVRNKFSKWRSIDIVAPNYAHFDGFVDLFLPTGGTNGYGSVHGSLYVKLPASYAQVDFSASVANVHCDGRGGLHFTSTAHARNIVTLEGTAPQTDGFQEMIRGPRHGTWRLTPSSKKGRLVGMFKVRAGDHLTDAAKSTLTRMTL